MTNKALENIKLLRSDEGLEKFARQCLKIKPKVGPLVPFVFNKAQKYIDAKLNAQKAETGMVRALVLKGRQQGASTYISARFYHKASLFSSTGVFILTHEQAATDNLFEIANRYHRNNPLAPRTGKSNSKELSFPGIESGYTVGTAGVKAGGRSRTIQLFHGSEVAFWPNDVDQFSGVVETVAHEAGTEIILESTAKGISNEFYRKWQLAEAGLSDYIAIFVPWFWDPGYRRPAPPGFALKTTCEEGEDISEADYAGLFELDNDQMFWRRLKIENTSFLTFKEEYPATADEAFQVSGHESFIKPHDILLARKNSFVGVGPLIVGVDPSRYGDDRFVVAYRRGRRVIKTETKHKVETVEAANWIRAIIDEDAPAKVFIDAGGGGAQIYDIVISYGEKYAEVMELVNFSSKAEEPEITLDDGSVRPGPQNRRAEMWNRSNEWLKQTGGADIPNDAVLQADACAPGYKYNTKQQLLIESKESMRKRKVRSPDVWDAIALTFASVVYGDGVEASTAKGGKRKTARSAGSAVLGGLGWMCQ